MTNPLEDASQIILNSVKRAQLTSIAGELLGTYTRDRLRFDLNEEVFGFGDMYMARFLAEILEGKAYSEELPVAMYVPASPWQHLKLSVQNRLPVSILGDLVGKFLGDLVGKFLPVRYKTHTTTVTLEGHWLYPQADIVTPYAGPVTIMEEATVPEGYYIPAGQSRFLSDTEIVNLFYQREVSFLAFGDNEAYELLNWLKHHKVNVNQLVPRNSL
jgi:hypothetical protein